MPMPGAIASGIFARKHIMKQPMALDMQVAATRDCFTARYRRNITETKGTDTNIQTGVVDRARTMQCKTWML